MSEANDWVTNSESTSEEAPSWQVPNVLGWLNKLNASISAPYRESSGRLDPLAGMTAESFGKEYPHLPKDGIPAMLDLDRLRTKQMADLIRERPPTWGEGIGAALVGAGKVIQARRNPNVDASSNPVVDRYLAEQKSVRDLGIKAQLDRIDDMSKTASGMIAKAAERAALMRDRQEMADDIRKNNAAHGYGAPASGVIRPDSAPIVSGVPGTVLGGGSTPAAPSAGGAGGLPIAHGGSLSATPRNNRNYINAQIAELYGRKPELYIEAWKADNAANHELDKARAGKMAEVETAGRLETDKTLAQKRAEKLVEDESKAENLAGTAGKMRQTFNSLEAHGATPGIGHLLGPFDNSTVGRWVNQANPWAANSGVRDRIEGDATALAILAKKVIREKGEGTFTEGDQAVLQGAIGNLLNSTDEKQYRLALDAARSRFSTILGVDIPIPDRTAPARTSVDATAPAGRRAPTPAELDTLKRIMSDPNLLAKYPDVEKEFMSRFGGAAPAPPESSALPPRQSRHTLPSWQRYKEEEAR